MNAFEKIRIKITEKKEPIRPITDYVFGSIGLGMVEEKNKIIDDILSIVSEVEAEYGKDINVRGNGWIPCSERLPEKSGRVLASYESINDEIVVSETNYDYRRKTFWISPCVVAWMPLPEPWKECR